jgi:hypothetical protein
MTNTKIIFALLLAIVTAFCFCLIGASFAMIALNHVSAKLGIALAVFSLLTGWLSFDSIVDITTGDKNGI